MGTHMGMATIGRKKVPMSNLVSPGADSRYALLAVVSVRALNF